MTAEPIRHLTPDDLDRLLAGEDPADAHAHLNACSPCRSLLRTEALLLERIARLPRYEPASELTSPIMASVAVRDPFALHSFAAARRRLVASPRALAQAAALALMLAGSMAGSVMWSLAHQETLQTLATSLPSDGLASAASALRQMAGFLAAQPWFDTARDIFGTPPRLALVSATLMTLYLSGLVALRRLVMLPAQAVTHAS